MANKFLFLVQRRGGGTLFNRVLAQQDDSEKDIEWHVDENDNDKVIRLPTKEPFLGYLLYSQVPEILSEKRYDLSTPHAFCMYAEPFGLQSINYAEPNGLPEWSLPNIDIYYPEDEWKVFFLVRDGRSHVTSLLRGEAQVQCGDGLDASRYLKDLVKFEYECNYWKMKSRLFLDVAKHKSHCKILKFEDLILDSKQHIANLMLDCGFTPEWHKEFRTDYNTTTVWSDSNSLDQNERFFEWEEQHFDICKSVMGPELQELGYTGKGI